MRTNKNFLETCHTRAQKQVENAISTNTTILKDFFLQNPEIFVDASQKLNNENPDDIEALRQSFRDARTALDKIGRHDATFKDKLSQHIDGAERSILLEDYDANRYFMPVKVSFYVPMSTSTETQEDSEDLVHISMTTKRLVNYESDVKTALLEKAQTTSVYTYFKEKGYYMPIFDQLVTHVGGYGTSRTEQEVELGVANKFMASNVFNKLKGIIKTQAKLKEVQDVVGRHRGEWMQNTTIAKCKDDLVIWPIIENDSYVKDQINRMEERIRVAKEEREAKLRQQREAAAAKRKAQLEALERGEAIVDDTVKVDRSHANLVRAINRIGGKE